MRPTPSGSIIRNSKKTAVLLAALLLCACSGSRSDMDFTRRSDDPAATYSYTDPQESPDGSELPPDGDGNEAEAQAETVVETEAPPETAAAVTTTEAPKPVGLKEEILESHSYSVENFPKKVYSNAKLKKALGKIDDICYDYGYSISFVYKNMDTGAVIRYNENTKYGVCSTVKAPFCKNLLSEGIDLDEVINISVIWDYDGGTVAQGGYGNTYTARELIKLAITESDNSAYYNLVNRYGYTGFNNMNYELGVGYDLGPGWIFNYGSANDLMKQYEDIYKYAEKSKRGEWLIKLMTKTDVESQITAQLSDKYTVAHKYGSDWDQNCYHDCAICYADSPFVLVIMTDQVPETEYSDKVFHKLAKQFDIINEQLVTG